MISRNGGHINPPLFDDWQYNKETFGEEDGECTFEFGEDEEVDIDDI